MPPKSSGALPIEDHRVRVARERRERTRNRLLETILATYRGDRNRGPAVLEEVLTRADVSKSNFYKHFQSLEAAVGELGERLADEMAAAIVTGIEHVTSPPDRLAMGFQLFLSRAASDPRWSSFVTHGTYLNPGHKLLVEVRRDFRHGIAAGDYKIQNVDAAVHLTVGTMVEGMRYLSATSPSRDYGEELTAMTLRGVGVPAKLTASIVRRAAARLDCEAGLLFPWWKQL